MLQRWLEKFGIDKGTNSENIGFTVDTGLLPRQRVDGKILLRNGKERCVIIYKDLINQGQYGLIQRCTRFINGRNTNIVVKRPRKPTISLESEAFLQDICNLTLEAAGCSGAIPEVHDVFLFADEVRFSMDWVDGKGSMEFFQDECKKPTFEGTFINCILQICILLIILERDVKFNHRDLTPNNLWIRYNPGKYVLDDVVLEFKYQVVLLDFGFACLDGKVSLGETIPPMDPCQKEGRDMYHLFSNLLASTIIVQNISTPLLSKLNEFMKPYEVKMSYLTYLITSDRAFHIKSLKPDFILRSLL